MNFEDFERYVLTHRFAKASKDTRLVISEGRKSVPLILCKDPGTQETGDLLLPEDYLMRYPQKLLAICKSRLGLNKIIFARNCTVKKISKPIAEAFLNDYHILNSTQNGHNLGLFHKNELVAMASFSKGRKMRRLSEDQRSYELIRFCCKSGVSVAGGLSKLVKNFCREKNAGDVMTYVDKQFSDGTTFIRAGFVKHSETPPTSARVNKHTYERSPHSKDEKFDPEKYYLVHNKGNIKLLYTP